MKDFLLQTYTIVLPILLGYIVWLLKQQKKDRDANSKGRISFLTTWTKQETSATEKILWTCGENWWKTPESILRSLFLSKEF